MSSYLSYELEPEFDWAEGENVPVVFVPGFMASQLERPGKGLLQPPLAVWPLNIYSLSAQLLVLRNLTPLKAEGLVGHYYDGLLDFLTRPRSRGGLGHTLERDLWIFAYDWRLSCREAGRELAHFIAEKLKQANARRIAQGLAPWQQVDLINHSMGGFVTRAAMREFNAPVRRVVYLAAGHYGSAKAYFALHPDTVTKLLDAFVKDFLPGWYWDLLKTLPNIWFLQGWLAKLLRLWPAMYELLPDRYYLEKPPGLLLDPTGQPVLDLEETYYRHKWRLPPEMYARVQAAMQFKAELGRDLPGTQNLVIYAETLPTYARARYHHRVETPEKLALGDGTVTAPAIVGATPATLVALEATHTGLPNLTQAHAVIRAFLTTHEEIKIPSH